MSIGNIGDSGGLPAVYQPTDLNRASAIQQQTDQKLQSDAQKSGAEIAQQPTPTKGDKGTILDVSV